MLIYMVKNKSSARYIKGEEDECSFYSLGAEFLEASKVLWNTPPTKIGYQSVIYYLLGHAAELFLKAFLIANDMQLEQLKVKGHNLIALVRAAHEHGLSDKFQFEAVRALSPMYEAKVLEYRDQKSKNFPLIDDLLHEVNQLSDISFPNFSHGADDRNSH